MQFVYQKDFSILKNLALQDLNKELHSKLGQPVLLLLSGGSAFQLLDQTDANNLSDTVTIGVLDERYSSDKNVNNFSQLTTTSFYQKANRHDCHFIDTSVKAGEKLNQLSERFDMELQEWKKKYPEGKVIITQGIGPDGHTSGIMPHKDNPDLFHQLFENHNMWAVGYDAGAKNKYPLRATTTIPFLIDIIDVAIVFVTGKNKKKALLNALNPKTKLFQTPAAVIQKMKNVTLFTDISIT